MPRLRDCGRRRLAGCDANGQGFFGKAALFKHIPVYYPDQVDVVGGAVGAIGGLGGFVLPLAFGLMNDLSDVWTSCFMLLFAIAAVNLL